ncbi:MAG: hypothetical protein ABSG78_21485 [Verrucomicrobiota bacterium]|jgi:hypothetical protein
MRARPNHGGMPWWHARPFYWLLLEGCLLLIAALAAAVWWVFSMPNMSGIREPNNGAQFIRERCHFFLIPPEWISGGAKATGLDSDPVWRWEKAEMKARAIVVFVLWVVGVSLLIWRHSRRRGQALPSDHPGSETSKLTAG